MRIYFIRLTGGGGTKKTTPRRRIASKNHSAGEGTKALARPPIAGGVGRSDRVGNCTTRIRQEFPESDDYNNYLQVLQHYTRRIFRTAQLPAERQIRIRKPSDRTEYVPGLGRMTEYYKKREQVRLMGRTCSGFVRVTPLAGRHRRQKPQADTTGMHDKPGAGHGINRRAARP